MFPLLGRRHFLKLSTALGSSFFSTSGQAAERKVATTQISWLDGPPSGDVFQGTTFGTAWPMGAVRAPARFFLGTSDSETQHSQLCTTALWSVVSV